jgi:TRAP-type C4-dicarboxylate transport system substrate-binding protein
MKKILSLLLILVLALSLVACGSSEPAGEGEVENVVLHFGSTQGTTHAWYEAAQNFAANVAAADAGLEIQIDFGGVHGSDKEHAEAVQNGALDMYLGSTVGFDAIVTSIGFVNLPYVVTTYDDVDSLIYNGWMGEVLKADAEAAEETESDSDEWDEDEIYFVYDELKKQFDHLTFEKISNCAGILTLKK